MESSKLNAWELQALPGTFQMINIHHATWQVQLGLLNSGYMVDIQLVVSLKMVRLFNAKDLFNAHESRGTIAQ